MDVAEPAVLRGAEAVGARGRQLMTWLAGDAGRPLIGAEVGVFAGAMSAWLLRRLPGLTLWMVDSWLPTERQPKAYRDCGDWHARQSREQQERYYSAARQAVAFAGDRARIIRMGSIAASSEIEDNTLDFAFIDADHSYEGCAADIRVWLPKLKPGGLVCGHDYDHPLKTRFGVKRAVDEAVARQGWRLELGADMTWLVRLP